MSDQRILLADHDETFLYLLEHFLQEVEPAYQITLARDGIAALTLLKLQPFQMLVADQKLPGLNGLDLARSARRHLPEIEVVLLTFQDVEVLNAKAKRYGLKLAGCVDKTAFMLYLLESDSRKRNSDARNDFQLTFPFI